MLIYTITFADILLNKKQVNKYIFDKQTYHAKYALKLSS